MLLRNSWSLDESHAALLKGSEVTGAVPQEIFALGLASLITMIAGSIHCGDLTCTGLEAWAVVCSSVSFAVCFLGAILHTVAQRTPADTTVRNLAVFFLVWWISGTGLLCFQNPFRSLGNGYFSSWAALIAAWLFATKHIDTLKDALEKIGSNGKEVAVLLFASAVLAVQAISDCGDGNLECSGEWVWALVCSIFSLVACISVAVAFEKVEPFFKWLVIGIFAWWSVGVLVLTFHRPYINTGNAYFSCWFAWCASGRLLIMQQKSLEQKPDGSGAFSALSLALGLGGICDGSDMVSPNNSAPNLDLEKAPSETPADAGAGPVSEPPEFRNEPADSPLPRVMGASVNVDDDDTL